MWHSALQERKRDTEHNGTQYSVPFNAQCCLCWVSLCWMSLYWMSWRRLGACMYKALSSRRFRNHTHIFVHNYTPILVLKMCIFCNLLFSNLMWIFLIFFSSHFRGGIWSLDVRNMSRLFYLCATGIQPGANVIKLYVRNLRIFVPS